MTALCQQVFRGGKKLQGRIAYALKDMLAKAGCKLAVAHAIRPYSL